MIPPQLTRVTRALPFRGGGGIFTKTIQTSTEPFKVLFFGRDEFSCLVLKELHASRDVWQSLDIATQPDMKVGRRGSKLSVSPLKVLGEEYRLPVHTIPPDKPSFRHWQLPPPFIPTPSPDPTHLLITASFGRILPKRMLDVFAPSRRLNVHPSLLPSYRGPAPMQHALINGEKKTGVSVIGMTEYKKGIDTGEIWREAEFPITEDTDFPSLRDQLGVIGGRLLVSVMRDMLAGTAKAVPQREDPSAPRAPLITAQDALVDPSSMTSEEVVRRHRAISHQKPLFAYLQTGRTLQLHDVKSRKSSPDELGRLVLSEAGYAIFYPPSRALLVRCANDTLLEVSRVKQQDRSLITAKEWWNGVTPDMRAVRGADSGPVVLTARETAT
ncbi:Formyltransferase [Panus rudis PR-1116 ss-1]|nr:Formyltransferase [Panus rudis PR-1116 ss-1]